MASFRNGEWGFRTLTKAPRAKSPKAHSSRTRSRRRMRVEGLEDRRMMAVVINEIHYNSSDNTSFEEFIELHNTAATPVDLSGWRFSDGVEYTFAPGQTIPANGYVVIAQNPAALQAAFGVTAIGQFTGGLNNDGERVALSNAQGVLIDEVEYSATFPWPIASDGGGGSMELINPLLDNNLGSNWRPSYLVPLFGEDNAQDAASAGALNDLVHRWSFSGNLVDSVGNANGVLVDPQGIATYGSGVLNVSANSGQLSNQFPFTSGAYVDLPNGIISSLGDNATFEWWGTIANNRTWAEIFSFGTSDAGENRSPSANNQDYITLIPRSGNNTVRATHRDGSIASESQADWNALPNLNVEYHFAVTWNSVTNLQTLYVNGQPIASSPTLIELAEINDNNNWLGRSQWNDPLFDGYHNEFRIYNRALTTAEVASSYTAGPDAVALGPKINSFTASSSEILTGQSVTLAWDVDDETSLSIDYGVGTVTGQTQTVVSPTQTTTYTLSATNAEGTTTRTVRVVVVYPRATPGSQNNSFAANAAPAITEVIVNGGATSGSSGVITAAVSDPNGVASVVLQYQIVAPGDYIPARLPATHSELLTNPDARPTANPEYFDPSNWVSVVMIDNGTGSDAVAGDGIYTATIPAQTHRTLVRYRMQVTDSLGASALAPYADDASFNFAYFVYDGIPEYTNNSGQVLANSNALASLPTYHLLTRNQDIEDAIAYDYPDQIPQGSDGRFVYNWTGAIVYNGKVYDNVTYRLRGANGRYYGEGKRSMRIRFNDGNWFEPLDQDGVPYPEQWKTLTTGKGFDNHSTLTYSLNEAMTMMLSNLMGLPAAETHWFQFRVIDDAAEAPDQWNGDFWGINFALEDYDKRFLDSHDMEAGNLYKLINQTNNALRQQDYQAPNAVSDGSDHDYIEFILSRASTDIEFRVNLEKYFVYHALVEAVRHYDYWPDANKNMVYYFEPDYLPENDNLGKLWLLLWDTDATWGPTWNEGKDVVYDALFENNNVPYRNGLIKPEYYNTLRELRDLIWQPDQIVGMITELASNLLPLEAADRARWQNVPGNQSGDYGGLGGAGATSITNLVQDMLNFAFVGGNWPSGGSGTGGGVGAGGRAAYLDALLNASGEEALIPNKPTISYVGDPSMAANELVFQTTPFTDPQGNNTFAAMEWRIAAVTPSIAGYDTSVKFLPEYTASWESGRLTTFSATIDTPTSAVKAGELHRARVRFQDSTGRWSHWSDPFEFTPTVANNLELTKDHLRITELHYNPTAGMPQYGEDAVDGEEFEFIEFINTSTTEEIDLSGVQLAGGVTFVFPNGTLLAPGQRILVVEDQGNFKSRYGNGLPIAGEWTGALSNGGEELIVLASDLTVIQQFEYDDAWYKRTDGDGSSLEVIDTEGDYEDPRNWRPSLAFNGTPAAAPIMTVDVVVNEVLANPQSPAVDAIELINTTGSTINIGGWWLSDQGTNLLKYQIPTGTILAAGGLISFNASQFNAGGGTGPNDFALSSGGDDVYLVASGAGGKPVRFADDVSFDATLLGVSLGRFPNGETDYGLFPLATPSIGAANSVPKMPGVVISEVQYHPAGPGAGITESQLEFIELHNTTVATVNLSGWRLSGGVDYVFPTTTSIAAGETIVVVSFNPATSALANAFRAHYGIGAGVRLVGAFTGGLDDRGDEVELQAPTTPPVGETGPVYYLVDRITYTAVAPWPTDANGGGGSLTRVSGSAFGDYAASWNAKTPKPGSAFVPYHVADFNEDGFVNQSDYDLWRANYGKTSGVTKANGDANSDGFVNAADYSIWRDNVGYQSPAMITQSFVTNEPEDLPAVAFVTAIPVDLSVVETESLSPSPQLLIAPTTVVASSNVRRSATRQVSITSAFDQAMELLYSVGAVAGQQAGDSGSVALLSQPSADESEAIETEEALAINLRAW